MALVACDASELSARKCSVCPFRAEGWCSTSPTLLHLLDAGDAALDPGLGTMGETEEEATVPDIEEFKDHLGEATNEHRTAAIYVT